MFSVFKNELTVVSFEKEISNNLFYFVPFKPQKVKFANRFNRFVTSI